LRGDVNLSTKTNQTALESAEKRGNPQSQILALVALCRNYYAVGDYENALR